MARWSEGKEKDQVHPLRIKLVLYGGDGLLKQLCIFRDRAHHGDRPGGQAANGFLSLQFHEPVSGIGHIDVLLSPDSNRCLVGNSQIRKRYPAVDEAIGEIVGFG